VGGDEQRHLEVGARPVVVEIDPVTRNIDLNRIEAAIRRRRGRIIPVISPACRFDRDRLYSHREKAQPACRRGCRAVVRSTWNGQRIGGSVIRVVQFSSEQNVTTIEGGALVLNDEREAKLAEQYRLQRGALRFRRDGGRARRRKVQPHERRRARGARQLPRSTSSTAIVASWRAYFELFDRRRAGAGPAVPWPISCRPTGTCFKSCSHEGAPRDQRAEVMGAVSPRRHRHGRALPGDSLFAFYRRLGWKEGDFPLAEATCRSILTLPLFPTMTRPTPPVWSTRCRDSPRPASRHEATLSVRFRSLFPFTTRS